MGEIQIVVIENEAPIPAGSFLQYLDDGDDGSFDGEDGDGATVFHRLLPDFMVQGSGFPEDGPQKTPRAPIENESGDTGLANDRGTLAMAQTPAPDSATSQLFIKVNDNSFLNQGSSENPNGYAVFAEVLEGIDVADAISLVARDNGNRPFEAVVIESVTRN